MRARVIAKALLISLGVTAVSLAAVVLCVITTAATHAHRGGAVVAGGVGDFLLRLSLAEAPAVFLLAFLILRRRRAGRAA